MGDGADHPHPIAWARMVPYQWPSAMPTKDTDDLFVIEAKIQDLIPDNLNANQGTERGDYLLSQSMQKLGAGRSVLLDKKGRVIAGNKTVAKFGEVGLEDVVIVRTDGKKLVAVQRTDLDLDSPQGREMALADNRVSEVNLSWDTQALAEIGQEVDLGDWFTEEELAGWDVDLDDFDPPSDEEDEETTADLIEQAEEGGIESRVKLGQVWALGRHRIACGDSTDEGNVRKLLGDKVPGMVWADAPYGMRLDADFSGAKSRLDFAREKKAFGGHKYENVIGDHEDFDPRSLIALFPSQEQFWWGADYYAERLPGKNDGSWFVWDKRVEESMDAVYGSGFELCWSVKKHKRQLVRVKWAGIFGMEKEDTKSRVHPTQKPSDLCNWFFEKYGTDTDLIFDPFLGSAPSIIAAQKMPGNRTVYGFELSPDYCEVILQRFTSFSGIVPELVGHL